MKRFFALLSIALTLTVVIALSAITFQPAAVDESSVESGMDINEKVIFISDSAATDGVTGDGSSPDKPLDPTPVASHLLEEKTSGSTTYGRYYLNTALYQAADKLKATGGTIVICGTVTIDNDEAFGSGTQKAFEFPVSEHTLKITSVYNGVDYRTNTKLNIEQKAHFVLNSPTVFEKININVDDANTICANANKLVMGEEITVTREGSNYLSIAGGHLSDAVYGSSDVTLQSGTYRRVCGATWNAVSGDPKTFTGNVNLTIEGTATIEDTITGSTPNGNYLTFNGNININIKGGTIRNGVDVTSAKGFGKEGYKANINISGGNFVNKYIRKATSSATITGQSASEYTVNFKNASSVSDAALNSLLSSATNNGFSVVYPATWADSIEVVSAPKKNVAFVGEQASFDGVVLNVEYLNPNLEDEMYSQTASYSDGDTAFTVEYDKNEAGTVKATYKYGGKTYYTDNAFVLLEKPEVNIHGAQILTSGKRQNMRFVGSYNTSLEVVEAGIIAIPETLCNNKEDLEFGKMYGMYNMPATYGAKSGNVCHFTGTLSEKVFLNVNQYNVDFYARSYVKVENNGETFYVYSKIIKRNVYDIAKEAAQSTQEDPARRKTLKSDVITFFENYTVPTKSTGTDLDYTGLSAELRNKVQSTMRSQMNVLWQPTESFWLYNGTKASSAGVKADLYFEAGKTYQGIPYTNANHSQLETFSDYLGQVVGQEKLNDADRYEDVYSFNVAGIKGLSYFAKPDEPTDEQYKAANANFLVFPGSDCSTSVLTSWNRIFNNKSEMKNLYSTEYLIPGRGTGVIPVGDYDYSYAKYQNKTTLMTKDSTNKALIIEAYKKCKVGDLVVTHDGSSGHVRMVAWVGPNYMTTIECANWDVEDEGWVTNNSSWAQENYYYEKPNWYTLGLIDEGYIPVTIPELVTGCSDNECTIATGLNLENDLAEGKLTGRVVSNRQIIDVQCTITGNGETKTFQYIPVENTDQIKPKYPKVHTPFVDLSMVDLSGLKLVSGQTYEFTMTVRVAGASVPLVKADNPVTFTAK